MDNFQQVLSKHGTLQARIKHSQEFLEAVRAAATKEKIGNGGDICIFAAGFIRREVLPYTPDAWIKEDATKIGYEVSFTRHFYKPQPLRTLEAISADILTIEKKAEGLLDGLLKVGAKP